MKRPTRAATAAAVAVAITAGAAGCTPKVQRDANTTGHCVSEYVGPHPVTACPKKTKK